MNTTQQTVRRMALLVFALAIAAISALGADDNKPAPVEERELIALLQSTAPKADKALACKQLAVHGSKEAIPVLAPLLADEELASWARIALEAIPDASADEALRNSLDSLQGKLLVGAINSLGVRQDELAVDALTKQLRNTDSQVASSAAAALGHIGNAAATDALQQSIAGSSADVLSAVAEGLILCAERALSAGDAAQATAIYDQVRNAEVPRQRKLEATRGAILARRDEGIPLLLEQLQSPDKAMFQLALSTTREFPGNKLDKVLATEFAGLSPERAALTIQAMADRKDTVVLSAVLEAAARGPKPVRLAGIEALGRVGDATCLSPLLDIALESDADVVQGAKSSLATLPGDGVDHDIVSRLDGAKGKTYPVLLELVGERRVVAAVNDLVKALDNADASIRTVALTSLGETVPANKLSVLIEQVAAPKHKEDEQAARKALRMAAVRMPDREACAAELATALSKSSVPTQVALLEIVGEVGGTKALNTVATAAKSNEEQLRDVSSRLLGQWMTIDAAPVLLDLTQSAPGEKYQTRALRAYIRIARQFTMDEPERIAMCQNILKTANQPAEQKLLLDVLKRYPNLETLKLAVQARRDVPAVKSEATEATLAIAQKLAGNPAAVREVLSKANLDKVKLEIVKAEYGSGETQKDVTSTLQKQAADEFLVSLPKSSYNETFGGDPVPGSTKQLKIQYRINGKAGEASFAENDLIVLPMPK